MDAGQKRKVNASSDAKTILPGGDQADDFQIGLDDVEQPVKQDDWEEGSSMPGDIALNPFDQGTENAVDQKEKQPKLKHAEARAKQA